MGAKKSKSKGVAPPPRTPTREADASKPTPAVVSPPQNLAASRRPVGEVRGLDDVQRAHFESRFEITFLKQRGESFQDFFSSLMEKTWPGEFTRLLPWGKDGDRKNDGLLRTRRMLFQCYAPNELKAAAAVAKIKDDFAGALTHWRAHFDTWVFVHNSRQGLGPQIVTALRDLGQKHAPLTVEDWGYEELRQQTFALSEADLSSLFGPAPTRRKMISLGLEELAPVLDQIARLPPPLGLDLRPVPADKLQRNMLSPSVQTLLTAGMSRADLVRKFFRLKPNLQDQIAESFRARYAELRKDHAPDAIFRELQRFAGGDSVLEPGAQEAVLAALAFFFEECDIFERPPSLEAP